MRLFEAVGYCKNESWELEHILGLAWEKLLYYCLGCCGTWIELTVMWNLEVFCFDWWLMNEVHNGLAMDWSKLQKCCMNIDYEERMLRSLLSSEGFGYNLDNDKSLESFLNMINYEMKEKNAYPM